MTFNRKCSCGRPKWTAIRAAISDSYYDARNTGLTMEQAADTATDRVLAIFLSWAFSDESA